MYCINPAAFLRFFWTFAPKIVAFIANFGSNSYKKYKSIILRLNNLGSLLKVVCAYNQLL